MAMAGEQSLRRAFIETLDARSSWRACAPYERQPRDRRVARTYVLLALALLDLGDHRPAPPPRHRSVRERPDTMLITKTHHDVPTKLDRNGRPIRIFVIAPAVPGYPNAKFPGKCIGPALER